MTSTARIREQLGLETAERVVPTGSMRPTIREGDSIRFRRSNERPRLGEIWVALRGEVHICHRVIWIRGERALLKGDALGGVDGWFEREDLFGPVSAIGHHGHWRPANRRRDRAIGLARSLLNAARVRGASLRDRFARVV